MEIITSEQTKFLNEFQKRHNNQTRTDGYMDFIEQAKVTSSEIMEQYDLQASVNFVIQNAISIDNFIEKLKQYGRNNRTPYVYKDYYLCTDCYLTLLEQCSNLPTLIEQAIESDGTIPIYNIGFPDAELVTIVEEWMQAYLNSAHPDEKYIAQFVLPEYQGSRENAIYKPNGISHLSIQKKQKTK